MNLNVRHLAACLGLTFALATASAANANCSYPRGPDRLPDGESATKEEMVAANKEVRRYNEEMTAYLNCIQLESDGQLADLEKQGSNLKTDDEKKAFVARKEEFERKRAQKHNAAVDEVTAVVDRFNEQLRLFKKKGS